MQTKKDVIEAALRGEGCLGKARDDEPVFTLVGDDTTMAEVVEFWAMRVVELSEGPTTKTTEALRFADEIRAWQESQSTVKIPD